LLYIVYPIILFVYAFHWYMNVLPLAELTLSDSWTWTQLKSSLENCHKFWITRQSLSQTDFMVC
jgi:hypothetical protein